MCCRERLTARQPHFGCYLLQRVMHCWIGHKYCIYECTGAFRAVGRLRRAFVSLLLGTRHERSTARDGLLVFSGRITATSTPRAVGRLRRALVSLLLGTRHERPRYSITSRTAMTPPSLLRDDPWAESHDLCCFGKLGSKAEGGYPSQTVGSVIGGVTEMSFK